MVYLFNENALNSDILPFFEKISLKKGKLNTIISDEIWEIEDLLNEKECKKVINYLEKQGFKEALLNIGGGSKK